MFTLANIKTRGTAFAWLIFFLALTLPRAPTATEGSADPTGQLYVRHWSAMIARNWSDEARCWSVIGRGCNLAELQILIDGLRGAAALRQLYEVNRAVNRAPYREDGPNWGVLDHWAAPRELLARGGDCEDYAIAKYLALRGLGFPARDLRLLILYDQNRRRAHAVLSVTLEDRELVLDNLHGAILPLGELPHYQVRAALNETGLVRPFDTGRR